MILQAAGLALLAALSPTALLVAAVYLGSARPRLIGTVYLVGAIIMSLVMGLVVIAILRNTGLDHHRQRTPRYGLRLGLGLLDADGGRRARPAEAEAARSGEKKQGLVSRMIADPAPGSAFAVGLLLFAPGITFIAAVQVIATAKASLELTAVAIVVVVVINVALVWLPLLLHLIAPGRNDASPDGFQWLAAREREQDTHRGTDRRRGDRGRQRHLRPRGRMRLSPDHPLRVTRCSRGSATVGPW